VFITGLVFTFLNQIVNPDSFTSVTLLYFTFVAVLLIKLIDEWRYYRSYNAPLASAIFVSIPTIIAIGGSIIAFNATLGDSNDILQILFLEMNLNLEVLQLDSFYLFLNLFGVLSCVPFYVVLGILFRRYYSGRYPNIFIFRKRFPSESIIAFNAFILVIFFVNWIDQKTIELSALFFVLFCILIFIQSFILKIVVIPFRRSTRLTPRTIRSRHSSIRSQQTDRAARRPISSLSNVSRPRNRLARTSHQSSVQVAPPVQVSSRIKSKLTPALIASLTPAGQHITKDDFRCIFCYEFPIDKPVVICPHCRHPSHADEFQKWLDVANICSRCNKPVNNVKMIRISGPSYQKIIQMFQKKFKN
jgi:hypothetical protein